MSAACDHAVSSANQFGGVPQDYYEIHAWFDATKAYLPDMRHRAIRHHSQGIAEVVRLFGPWLRNSDGEDVPVQLIAEQHVIEDMGRIMSMADWLTLIPLASIPNNPKPLRALRNKESLSDDKRSQLQKLVQNCQGLATVQRDVKESLPLGGEEGATAASGRTGTLVEPVHDPHE